MELLARAAQGRAGRGPGAGGRACWRAAHVAQERVGVARGHSGVGPRLHALSFGCRLRLRHAAQIDKGLYPKAFCKIIPDLLAGDPGRCLLRLCPTRCAQTAKRALRALFWQRDRVFVCMSCLYQHTYVCRFWQRGARMHVYLLATRCERVLGGSHASLLLQNTATSCTRTARAPSRH